MKSALAIAAHPDDIEFLMAGTLILLRAAGYELHYWNLANGCCGSDELDAEAIAAIRREEGQKAASLIGARFHDSICPDLGIFYDRETLARVAAVVRAVAPDIILTHAPVDYMEDHTNTCRLAVTAAFGRGMPNFVTDPPQPATQRPTTVYHAQPYSHRDPLGQPVIPEYFVDITSVHDQKQQMLAEHQSQKIWLDRSQGLDSYLKTQRELDAEAGRMSGRFRYAEGWRRHLHLGFCGPMDDPLADALGEHVLSS